MTNCTNTTTVNVTHDIEDRILMALPQPLRTWLKEEADTDYNVVEVFKAWRDGVSVPQLLQALRSVQRNNTVALYGRSHPQARAA